MKILKNFSILGSLLWQMDIGYSLETVNRKIEYYLFNLCNNNELRPDIIQYNNICFLHLPSNNGFLNCIIVIDNQKDTTPEDYKDKKVLCLYIMYDEKKFQSFFISKPNIKDDKGQYYDKTIIINNIKNHMAQPTFNFIDYKEFYKIKQFLSSVENPFGGWVLGLLKNQNIPINILNIVNYLNNHIPKDIYTAILETNRKKYEKINEFHKILGSKKIIINENINFCFQKIKEINGFLLVFEIKSKKSPYNLNISFQKHDSVVAFIIRDKKNPKKFNADPIKDMEILKQRKQIIHDILQENSCFITQQLLEIFNRMDGNNSQFYYDQFSYIYFNVINNKTLETCNNIINIIESLKKYL